MPSARFQGPDGEHQVDLARAVADGAPRLERARFHPEFARDGKLAASAIEPADLALILGGIDLAGARRRRRWEPRSSRCCSATRGCRRR
jgi:hypothetical protein